MDKQITHESQRMGSFRKMSLGNWEFFQTGNEDTNDLEYVGGGFRGSSSYHIPTPVPVYYRVSGQMSGSKQNFLILKVLGLFL